MTGAAPRSVPPTLSIIVPTYGDGPRIYGNLVRLDHALVTIGEPYEIIVVSDGNADNTRDEARRLNAPHMCVYHYTRNMGKGFALRYGVARSRGEIVTFIDGDGDIDPAQIATYLRIMRETGADTVVGSKRHPGSQVIYPPLRRLYSALYQLLLRLLFRLEVRDTQVGLKLFRRAVLAAVLPRIVVKRYAFDLELLVVACHLGFSHVVEAPVRIGQRFSSTINRRAIVSILWETVAICYRKNVLQYYDRCHGPVALDTLPAVTETELSTAVDEQHSVRSVALWLMAGCARMRRTCYSRRRVLVGQGLATQRGRAQAGDKEDIGLPGSSISTIPSFSPGWKARSRQYGPDKRAVR
jgi:hypothetical protein